MNNEVLVMLRTELYGVVDMPGKNFTIRFVEFLGPIDKTHRANMAKTKAGEPKPAVGEGAQGPSRGN